MPGAMRPPQEGKVCYGVDMANAPVDSLFRNRRMDLSVLLRFYARLDRGSFFRTSSFDRLAGGSSFRTLLEIGYGEDKIRAAWRPALAAFHAKRKKYLLYPDFPQSY